MRKDDVETRLRNEIVLLKQENERLVKEYMKMKKIRIITFGLILAILCVVSVVFSSCTTPPKSVEETENLRWPDFLRDWAADCNITDAQRLAVIDQIDSLYMLVEDSTSDDGLLCNKLCELQGIISDMVAHDTNLFFSLMMQATASNIWGMIYRNPWLFEKNCPCNLLEYLVAGAHWFTYSSENEDIMLTSFIGQSWQAWGRHVDLTLTKKDGFEWTGAEMIVYNHIDTAINNLQIIFADSSNTFYKNFTEEGGYIELPTDNAGMKVLMLSPPMLMESLAADCSIYIYYETPHDTVEMIGFPHLFFKEQIEDCPRLKKALDQITR